jgi:ubiquinone/menaquinone biosynthesis C-methylase UbiE
MQDPDLVFSEIGLEEGDTFVDLGCGPGDYALEAARRVGRSGLVYALDKWKRMIDDLAEDAALQGIKNLNTLVTDITEPLPLDDRCCDVCFMATVHHALPPAKRDTTMVREIRRILRPGGRVAIINCKKEEQPFGPAIHIRLSPEEMDDIMTPFGFERTGLVDLGYNYLIQFRLEETD